MEEEGISSTKVVLVMSSMKSFVITWFWRMTCHGSWCDASKIFTERANGLDGQGGSSFDTVCNYWLPHVEPVIKMMDIGLFDIGVEFIGDWESWQETNLNQCEGEGQDSHLLCRWCSMKVGLCFHAICWLFVLEPWTAWLWMSHIAKYSFHTWW
jgi:hypothetical protein